MNIYETSPQLQESTLDLDTSRVPADTQTDFVLFAQGIMRVLDEICPRRADTEARI